MLKLGDQVNARLRLGFDWMNDRILIWSRATVIRVLKNGSLFVVNNHPVGKKKRICQWHVKKENYRETPALQITPEAQKYLDEYKKNCNI